MKISKNGFTLIELMIVVAIIGILAAVAMPKFADLVRRSKEGKAKGQLGGIRSALSLYYADAQEYPSGSEAEDSTLLADTLIPSYIKEIPTIEAYPYHNSTTQVSNVSSVDTVVTDNGQWEYIGGPGAAGSAGIVFIRCDSLDSKGVGWSTY